MNQDISSMVCRPSKKLKSDPIIEKIINTPGLQHIGEKILLNLDFKNIMVFQSTNNSCKEFVDNPMFWLKKWRLRGLSTKSQGDWIKAIQMTRGTKVEANIDLYIKKSVKFNYHFMDVPCYIDASVVESFSQFIDTSKNDKQIHFLQWNIEHLEKPSIEREYQNSIKQGKAGFLQLLAPIMKNPNPINRSNEIPYSFEDRFGSTDVLYALAPLVEDPNAPDEIGDTPIHCAASKGQLDIIKLLAPLAKNPNCRNWDGKTPIFYAACWGHPDVVKYLASFDKYLNSPCNYGMTAIFAAAKYGHANVIKVLAPLVEDPNASCTDFNGKSYTPIQIAERKGYQEIVEILQPYVKI